MTVADRINALLREKGIGKYKFYEECRVSSGAFSMWKRGVVNPSRKSIEDIVDYLNTTPEYLLTGEEEKEKPAPIKEDGLTEDQIKVLRLFDSLTPQEQHLFQRNPFVMRVCAILCTIIRNVLVHITSTLARSSVCRREEFPS